MGVHGKGRGRGRQGLRGQGFASREARALWLAMLLFHRRLCPSADSIFLQLVRKGLPVVRQVNR